MWGTRRTLEQATPTGVYMTLSEADDTRDAQHCVSPVSKGIYVVFLPCFMFYTNGIYNCQCKEYLCKSTGVFDTSGRISNLSSSIMRVSPNVLALRLINVFKMLRLFWEIVVHLTDLHKLFQGLNCDARVTVELHKREVYLRQNFARYFMKTKTYCKH